MSLLPSPDLPRLDLGGLKLRSTPTAGFDIDDIICYAQKPSAPAPGKPKAAQTDSQDAGKDEERAVDTPTSRAAKERLAEVDGEITGTDEALSHDMPDGVRQLLEVRRDELGDERERLAVLASPENVDTTAMADAEFAVGTDVRNQDLDRGIDRAIARTDEKIASLEERRSELKGEIDGASADDKPALTAENREVQIEIKKLQTQRADLEAAKNLPAGSDALMIATDVYNDESMLQNTHLKRMSHEELLEKGLDPALLRSDKSDLQAEVYRNENTGEVVMVFRGSEPTSWDDWETDFKQASGFETGQYKEAERLAARFDDAFPDEKKVITGHSLGGGLAAYGGLATGNNGIEIVTFNAAGLHDNSLEDAGVTRAEADGRVTNFHIDGELLTAVQQSPISPTAPFAPNSVGEQYGLQPHDNDGPVHDLFGPDIFQRGGLHMTGPLNTSMRAEIDKIERLADEPAKTD